MEGDVERDWGAERRVLVDSLISGGYLRSDAVIDAMLSVPRHEFIPLDKRMQSYIDSPLSIGFGQTISAPHMVAIMSEHLDACGGHKILEVGSGSGYQAAVLSKLVSGGRIFTVERIKELADFARENLERCGYMNAKVIHWEGSVGYDLEAPYDRVIVTAAAPKVPEALIKQLRDGGKMLIPVGGRMMQTLLLIKKDRDRIVRKDVCGCVFVPLIGEEGW